MTFTTEAIVLNYSRYRDNDRIYTVYTRENGKLALMARGSNKIKSKLAGHMEPGCHSFLMIARGRAIPILAQASSVTSFARLRSSFEKFSCALATLEVIDALTHQEEPDTRIFDLLYKTLKRIASHTFSPIHEKALQYCYLLRLLIYLGHAPNVAHQKILQPLLVADIEKDAILLSDDASSLTEDYLLLALGDKRLSAFSFPA